MRWRRALTRLAALAGSARHTDDLREEIDAHVRSIEDELVRDGVPTAEARARARRTFGNVTLAKERAAEAWGFAWIDSIRQDVRYTRRMIRRAPGVSLTVIAIVAIAIAASTALYSLADACVLHAIRYPVVDRWVVVRAHNPGQRTYRDFLSVPELEDVEGLTDVFEHVGAIVGTGFTTSDGEFPEHVDGTRVTANGLRMTGVPPLLGRTFTDAEDRPGAPGVVVLSYEFWMRKYDGDRGVLGRRITLDREPRTIIGVMPPHFGLWGGDLWVPLQLDRLHVDRKARLYWIIAVTRRGVTPAAVDARLRALSDRLAVDFRSTDPEYADERFETWNIEEAVVAGIRPAFFALSVGVVLLLLLACVNIATLLLARALTRGRELGARAALGAGRGRLIRQMFTESFVLSCAGGIAGVLLAMWALPLLFHLVPADFLASEVDPNVHVNLAALLVAVGTTIATGALFGTIPAVFATGSNLAHSLRTRGTTSYGSSLMMQRLLLVTEIALVLVALSSAALTIVSYRRAHTRDLGFVPDHVLTFSFTLPGGVYRDEGAIAPFHENLLTRLRRIPGVTAAGETSLLPLGYRTVDITSYDIGVEGRPVRPGGPPDNASFRIVSPGYFGAVGTPLIEGRTFNASDDIRASAVALVNETMARRYWPKGAIGRVFRLQRRQGPRDILAPLNTRAGSITVVGVVHDAKQTNVIEAPVRPEFFLPLSQHPADARKMAVLLRTAGDPEAAANAVRRIVKDVDPEQPIADLKTLDAFIASSLGARRLTLLLLSFFAGVSLLLAAVGLYAAASHGVTQRTREIGIRMALGADARQVIGLIAAEGVRVTAVGLLAGVFASIAIARVIGAQLYDVTATDPLVLSSVSAILAVVALAATLVPTRRAVHVDPLIALKPE